MRWDGTSTGCTSIAELHAQIVERADVERIRHRHQRGVPLALDRQHPVLLGEADRHDRGQIRVDVVGLEVGGKGDAELAAERLQHVRPR